MHSESITELSALKWNGWMLAAAATNVVSTLLNIFAASLIARGANASETTLLIISIAVISLTCGYFLTASFNMIALRSDIYLRRILSNGSGIASSRVNNDIPLAVGAIQFYAAAPGMFIAATVYFAFIAHRSPLIATIVVAGASVMAYPLYRYAAWRRRRIAGIREARNRLLDEFGTDEHPYKELIDTYAGRYYEFWWKDVLFGFVPMAIIASSFFLVPILSKDNSTALAVIIVYILFMNSLRNIYLRYISFQENKRSLHAIKNDLSIL